MPVFICLHTAMTVIEYYAMSLRAHRGTSGEAGGKRSSYILSFRRLNRERRYNLEMFIGQVAAHL